MQGCDDAGASEAVAVGVDGARHTLVGRRVVDKTGYFVDNLIEVGADEFHGAGGKGFGALCGVAHHEYGFAQSGGFFLNASAVGEHYRGFFHKIDERQVFKRLDEEHIAEVAKVVAEHWLGEGDANKPHILNSVSKTFTSMAVGFAIAEGKLKLTDKVISFFPDEAPAAPNENVKAMTIRNLLTMSSGHATDPTANIRKSEDQNWAKAFFDAPVEEQPGSRHVYNSLGTYMLSAIVQKVTGEKVIDYLYPRLFRPLGIVGATWQESPQGINAGGWGLYLKTEDLAKVGQFLLQKGEWNGKQLLPKEWIEEASSNQIASYPANTPKEKYPEMKQGDKRSDWLQGYGYQMWRCRHNCFRADGANGQFIIVVPERDAVIAMTANIGNMQAELDLVWKYIYPALK